MKCGNRLFAHRCYHWLMTNDVFKFRTLKWGDPDRKLKMLPDEAERARAVPWIEIGLIVFTVTMLAICAYYLLQSQ